MFIFDISAPLTLLLMTLATGLLIFLSQEIKKSMISAVTLFAYLVIVIIHVIQFLTLPAELRYLTFTLGKCIMIDFLLIFVTFLSYLWTDDLEAKAMGKKSIDNSLDWFWKSI